MSPVLYIEGCTSPCTVHRPGALQKCSHQPLISPVLYTSLECFRSAPISYESRTSEKRTENKVKQKVNIRGYPGISPGRFVHCQYRNQSVSTLCTCEKQSVSVTIHYLENLDTNWLRPQKSLAITKVQWPWQRTPNFISEPSTLRSSTIQ